MSILRETDYFDDRVSYMLLYAACVDELLEFEVDDESRARVIIDWETFITQHTAGNKQLMETSIDKARQLLGVA